MENIKHFPAWTCSSHLGCAFIAQIWSLAMEYLSCFTNRTIQKLSRANVDALENVQNGVAVGAPIPTESTLSSWIIARPASRSKVQCYIYLHCTTKGYYRERSVQLVILGYRFIWMGALAKRSCRMQADYIVLRYLCARTPTATPGGFVAELLNAPVGIPYWWKIARKNKGQKRNDTSAVFSRYFSSAGVLQLKKPSTANVVKNLVQHILQYEKKKKGNNVSQEHAAPKEPRPTRLVTSKEAGVRRRGRHSSLEHCTGPAWPVGRAVRSVCRWPRARAGPVYWRA